MRKPLALLLSVLPLFGASLESEFARPPMESKPHVFWLWLHTPISKSRITYELEQMKKQGIGGLLQWDPGAGPGEYGTRGEPLPHGPEWMSTEWREALHHTFREAERLGLDVNLTLMPGANCGGPWVTPRLSAQKLVFGTTRIMGPQRFTGKLDLPQGVTLGPDGKPLFYRDVAVFAAEFYRLGHGRSSQEISDVMPLSDFGDVPIENPWVDVTKYMDAQGNITWDVPPGAWRFLRVGYTATGQNADYFGSQKALYVDHLSHEAVEQHFTTMFDWLFGKNPLPKSLKGVHCDSFEVYGADWTPTLMDEFRRRRGYDPTRWLPTLEGGNIDSRHLTARFLEDMNRTRSDLFHENHYRLIEELSHKRGIAWQTEAGGPRMIASDSLQMLGTNDVPVGEFWMECRTHRVTPEERYYVKGPASAAHVYGKRWVAAEAFTSIGNHWNEDPRRLKPVADEAFLQGVNRMVLHTFDHSPEQFGKPGAVYFAGTHTGPNVTWWDFSHGWFDYLARCQHMLSRGLFVADVLFYNGDQVPNFVQMRHVDPRLGPGYDYDVANAEVLLTRATVRDGRIVLPDGMSYRVLVLPERKAMSVEVLNKIGQLVRDGATVIGPPPVEATGLMNYQARDAEVKRLAAEIWAGGKVIQDRSIRQVLAAAQTPPDFQAVDGVDFLHRRDGSTDIYFVVNKTAQAQSMEARFRVTGKAPEFWDPATGKTRTQPLFREEGGQTTLPLRLAPYESLFVVFRNAAPADPVASVTPAAEVLGQSAADARLRAASGEYRLTTRSGRVATVTVPSVPAPLVVDGNWTVRFTPGWGAPESATFDKLISWTERPEEGIRHFSGTATYATTFRVAAVPQGARQELDLGVVQNLAEVWLNGHNLGVVWKQPFRVDATGLVQAGVNRLEVKVVNLWTNRLIGDESLPKEKRFTKTNMFPYTASSPLAPSGLMGPVRLISTPEVPVHW